MFSLLWNLSAALRGYLRFYLPTNRAVDWLRTPRGLKWAIPAALIATPACVLAASLSATVVARGGPGYANFLVLLFFWNAVKFAFMGGITSVRRLRARLSPDHRCTRRADGEASASSRLNTSNW